MFHNLFKLKHNVKKANDAINIHIYTQLTQCQNTGANFSHFIDIKIINLGI